MKNKQSFSANKQSFSANNQSFPTNMLITIVLLLLLILVVILVGNFIFSKTSSQALISPDGKTLLQQITKQTDSPTPTPSPTPIEYHFDQTTDLKQELETINPEVLDSDFDNLKKITTSL